MITHTCSTAILLFCAIGYSAIYGMYRCEYSILHIPVALLFCYFIVRCSMAVILLFCYFERFGYSDHENDFDLFSRVYYPLLFHFLVVIWCQSLVLVNSQAAHDPYCYSNIIPSERGLLSR